MLKEFEKLDQVVEPFWRCELSEGFTVLAFIYLTEIFNCQGLIFLLSELGGIKKKNELGNPQMRTLRKKLLHRKKSDQ